MSNFFYYKTSCCTIAKKTFLKYILFLFGLFPLVLYVDASAILTAKANHDHIKIDSFYAGSTVSVAGFSQQGVDLVIKIVSPETEQSFRKKGKIGNLLWMNTGEINFDNISSLYFLHSTKKVEDILTAEERDKHILGYDALQRHARISPAPVEGASNWFGELVKFKESSTLYSVDYGKIACNTKDGKQNYRIVFKWPYQASPGDYRVSVYAVKDGKVLETAESKVLVEQAGAVKTLAGLAKSNGALFGIISILVALSAGFGVGMIFSKGEGAH
ncbi:MAG: TIGR02186 family protein [Pseudomonadota bacterium]